METRITTGTIVAMACSAVLAYAAPQQPTKITGCLLEGAAAGSYVLTQSSGRYDVIADAKTDLSKLVGREVEATGTQAWRTPFTVKTIKQKRSSC